MQTESPSTEQGDSDVEATKNTMMQAGVQAEATSMHRPSSQGSRILLVILKEEKCSKEASNSKVFKTRVID